MYVRYRHTHNCLHRHVCRYHICIYDTYTHIHVYNWVQVRIYGVYTYRHVYNRVVLSRTMNQLARCACICVYVHRNGTHCTSSLYVWGFNVLDIFSYIWSMYVLYVCMNLCTLKYLYLCMYACIFVYMYKYQWYICMHMYSYMYTCISKRMDFWFCVNINMYIYVYTYIYDIYTSMISIT